MTYHIITIGCQMNKADSERLAAYLETRAYSPLSNFKKANVVILTTCGVRQSAEDRVYGLANQIKKANPKTILILTGCLSNRADVKRRLKNQVDLWLPIIDLLSLDDKIKSLNNKKSPNGDFVESQNNYQDYLSTKPQYSSKFSAYVPIGNGCNNFCAYCVVPYARGRETYRPAKEIIAEVQKLIKQGYKEIALIAQNVNSYKSGSVDFADLVSTINSIKGDFWLRFVSSHPKDMSDKLIKTLAKSKKMCEHIHLALQSGDDEILRVMNRKYTSAHFSKLVKKIRLAYAKSKLPVAITTDVIVGFPGETKAQFLNTVKIFNKLKFDFAYVSRYSPRFGTVSYKMKDNVSALEKKRRDEILMGIIAKTALVINKKYLKKVVEILVEGKNKKGEYYGKTRTFKNVRFLSDKKDLIGSFIKVKIDKVEKFGLKGDDK